MKILRKLIGVLRGPRFGPNLLGNGGNPFVSTTGLGALNSAVLSVVGGKLSVVNGGAAAGWASQSCPTVANVRYRVYGRFFHGDARGTFRVGTFAGSNSLFDSGGLAASQQPLDNTFIASGSTTHLSVGHYDNTPSAETVFDDLRVQRVNY